MDNPLAYIGSNSLQTKDTRDLLEQWIGSLEWTSKEQVLDVGCGPGDVTATVLFPLLPEDATLVGCDISEEMIKYCKQRIKNDRMSFKTQDIQDKNIACNLQLESFSKIFSFYCLQWVIDQRQAMENIYSLLKPGGEILLMSVTPDHPIILTTYKLKVSEKWSKYIKDRQWFFKMEDPPTFFNEILQGLGFLNINCYLQKKSYHFPSIEALSGLIKAVNPHFLYIPEELKFEYIQDFLDHMKQEKYIKFNRLNEVVELEYKLLVIMAQKPKK